MTDLCGLPDELLVAVAKCLRDDNKNRYSDLNHLALSCRKLRPIAQEVLYTEVPKNPTPKRSLANLARTLLQRPDLAKRVRKLNIDLSGMSLTHHRSCLSWGCQDEEGREDCTCGIPELVTLFQGLTSTVNSRNGVSLHNEGWEDMLMRGIDAALVGLILYITPALDTFSLTTLNSPMDPEYHKNNAAWAEVEKLFELISRHVGLAGCFLGLSSLTRLLTTGCAPSSWLSLPRLEAARFDLFEDPDHTNKMISNIAPGVTVSTTLTRLVVQPEFKAFYCDKATNMEGVYGQFRIVVSGLTSLTHLFVLYRAAANPLLTYEPLASPQGSFAHIVSRLESRSLTDLTVDVEPAPEHWGGYVTMMLGYIHDTTPMTTFAGLPRLLNLNGPQQAFFSVNEGFQTCRLPTTIESIGIMNSTSETKRYLKHLLDRQTESPNLKNIKLGEIPCNDQSVCSDGSSDDDASESGEGERRKAFDLDDPICEQARSRGLQVEKVQDRTTWKKGWKGLDL